MGVSLGEESDKFISEWRKRDEIVCKENHGIGYGWRYVSDRVR